MPAATNCHLIITTESKSMWMSVTTYVTRFVKTLHICTQWQRTFSLSIHSSINKLTNYHNTTAKRWLVCFFWGYLSDVHKCTGVDWIPLVGLYRHPPCWESLTDLFMLWTMDLAKFYNIECNGSLFSAILS